jgi:3-hydroxybutyryl-CoA dehydrogenase
MGHALALEFARAGYEVRIHDESESQLESVPERVRNTMSILAEYGLAEANDADQVIERITCTRDLKVAAEASQFVIEAVAEDLSIKQKVFSELDAICGPDVILASNTSAISPTALGNATKKPDRVLVTHYFNPPYLLPAVEVVPGEETSRETVEAAVAICRSIGKAPAVLRTEIAGFVVNRLQFALYREASFLVDEGIISSEDLDRLVVTSIGNRLGVYGPFKIADLAGLDVYESICRSVFPVLNKSDGPPEGLRKLVEAGSLGAKSGRGVYDWSRGVLAEVTGSLARHAAAMFGPEARS